MRGWKGSSRPQVFFKQKNLRKLITLPVSGNSAIIMLRQWAVSSDSAGMPVMLKGICTIDRQITTNTKPRIMLSIKHGQHCLKRMT